MKKLKWAIRLELAILCVSAVLWVADPIWYGCWKCDHLLLPGYKIAMVFFFIANFAGAAALLLPISQPVKEKEK